MPSSTLTSLQPDATRETAIDWHRPLVIGCCPSSGSTLLSVMLDAHPQVMCGPELSLLAHPFVWQGQGESWRRRLIAAIDLLPDRPASDQWNLACGAVPYIPVVDRIHLNWYGLDVADLRALIAQSQNVDDLLRAVLGPVLLRSNKRIWAEKSPPNIYAVPDFLDRYPQGQAIVMVRDGRDVVCSLLKRGFTLAEASSIWLVEAGICKQLGGQENVCLLRYEDLAIVPEKTLEALQNWLGLALATDRMLSYDKHSRRTRDDASICVDTWTKQPTGGIHATIIGRWRKELAPEELELFYRHELKGSGMTTVGLLADLGYDPPETRLHDDSQLCGVVHHQRVLSAQAPGAGRMHRVQTRFGLDAESLLQLATIAQTSLDEIEAALAQTMTELATTRDLLAATEYSRDRWEENWRAAQHQVELLEVALQNSFGNRMRRKFKAFHDWFRCRFFRTARRTDG